MSIEYYLRLKKRVNQTPDSRYSGDIESLVVSHRIENKSKETPKPFVVNTKTKEQKGDNRIPKKNFRTRYKSVLNGVYFVVAIAILSVIIVTVFPMTGFSKKNQEIETHVQVEKERRLYVYPCTEKDGLITKKMYPYRNITYPEVNILRNRINALKGAFGLEVLQSKSLKYTNDLVSEVKYIQRVFNEKQDGIIGVKTIAILNKSCNPTWK